MSLLALLLALFVLPALAAVGPDEILADPALEARAREIGRSLRCVVCQNQSIDDSSADLAKDMRKIVRERLLAGDSDAQIYAFMTRRYGDFVLLQPPFKPYTLLLWLGPAIALLLAALLLWRLARRRAALLADMTAAAKPLDAEERARLDRLLRDEPR
jgi:cytochrome c-type biogenesis protein CcmH